MPVGRMSSILLQFSVSQKGPDISRKALECDLVEHRRALRPPSRDVGTP
jgi:hypothetical protein